MKKYKDEDTFHIAKVKYAKEKKKHPVRNFILFLIILFLIINGFLVELDCPNVYSYISEKVKPYIHFINEKTVATTEEETKYEYSEIDDMELNEILENYILLNRYADEVKAGNKPELSLLDYTNKAKLYIAYNLLGVKYQEKDQAGNELMYDRETVNAAIEEATLEEVKVTITTVGNPLFEYDKNVKAYTVKDTDEVFIAKVKQVETIDFDEETGIYSITFKYCYPDKENLGEEELDLNYDEFEATVNLKENREYKYAKYAIIDSDKIDSKVTKKVEVEEVVAPEEVKAEENKPQTFGDIKDDTTSTNPAFGQVKVEEKVETPAVEAIQPKAPAKYLGTWTVESAFDVIDGKDVDKNLMEVYGSSIRYGFGTLVLKADGSFEESLAPVSEHSTPDGGKYTGDNNSIVLNYSVHSNHVQNATYDESKDRIRLIIDDSSSLNQYGVILKRVK